MVLRQIMLTNGAGDARLLQKAATGSDFSSTCDAASPTSEAVLRIGHLAGEGLFRAGLFHIGAIDGSLQNRFLTTTMLTGVLLALGASRPGAAGYDGGATRHDPPRRRL